MTFETVQSPVTTTKLQQDVPDDGMRIVSALFNSSSPRLLNKADRPRFSSLRRMSNSELNDGLPHRLEDLANQIRTGADKPFFAEPFFAEPSIGEHHHQLNHRKVRSSGDMQSYNQNFSNNTAEIKVQPLVQTIHEVCVETEKKVEEVCTFPTYFRLGIVVLDCDQLTESSIAAIANPVSKCRLVSFVVLNDKQKPIADVVKTAKQWIRRNYTVGLRKHEQYLNPKKPQHGDCAKKTNLQYHFNQLMKSQTSGELETEGNDDDGGGKEENVNDNNSLIIEKESNVEILLGESGFERLLLAKSDDKNSSFVDGVYVLIQDAEKQHPYAMAALQASKHVLLNSQISTPLSDFCEQLKLAKTVNRFLQFSLMFVHQYRVKTFLDCVTSSESFGKIQSIDVILNVNYNDAHKVGVTYPLQRPEHGCIRRLGRFCVLVSSLILHRSPVYNNNFLKQGQLEDQEHRPLTVHVKSFTTVDAATAGNDNNDSQKNDGQAHNVEVPISAECVVEFTNNRVLTFRVQYSQQPTRQVLTVRAAGRHATMSDFLIPHPDGLSTCRLYDSAKTIINEAGKESESFDVVCGEAVDIPSGPPQDVIMWRKFCELSRAIEQEGWEINDALDNFYDETDNNSNGGAVESGGVSLIRKAVGRSASMSSYSSSGGVLEESVAGLAEAQEARDIANVSIETKCITAALSKSCELSHEIDPISKKKIGVPVSIELPEVW